MSDELYCDLQWRVSNGGEDVFDWYVVDVSIYWRRRDGFWYARVSLNGMPSERWQDQLDKVTEDLDFKVTFPEIDELANELSCDIVWHNGDAPKGEGLEDMGDGTRWPL